MEKYLKAVSEMYSQFKKFEAHPMDEYLGRHVIHRGRTREVVGHTTRSDGLPILIVNASEDGGWVRLSDKDVIIKKCESYWYVSINDLID